MFNSLFKVDYKEVSPERRGFFIKDSGATTHLENIGTSFLDGYHKSLDVNSVDEICDSNDQKHALYRGFSYEGAAMGLAIKDVFRSKKNKKLWDFLNNKASDHIYMAYVGIGWAYARLPIKVESILKKYDPVLGWLIIDGYGFHEAYFKTKAYVQQKKVPNLSPEATHVFYQGVGRCLLFVCGIDVDCIKNTILSFPQKYQSDLWAGLGLAATYAGILSESELLILRENSGKYQSYLFQGVAFAAKARERAGIVTTYTDTAVRVLTGLAVKDVASVTDNALKNLPSYLDSSAKYLNWRSLIREELSSRIMYTNEKNY